MRRWLIWFPAMLNGVVTRNGGSTAYNMFFTQGRGFVLGASLDLRILSLRCRVLVFHAADTASLAARILFGKLI